MNKMDKIMLEIIYNFNSGGWMVRWI